MNFTIHEETISAECLAITLRYEAYGQQDSIIRAILLAIAFTLDLMAATP